MRDHAGRAGDGQRIAPYRWARTRVAVLTELKYPKHYARGDVDLVSLTEAALRRHDALRGPADGWITVQSFDEDTVRRAAAVFGERIPTSLLLEPDDTPPLSTERLNAIAQFAAVIGPGKLLVERDPAIVARAHNAGLRVTPWTFRTSTVGDFADVGAEMRHYVVEWGVDAVITDHPAAYPDDRNPA